MLARGKPAHIAPAKNHCKRGDYAKHGKRAPSAYAARQAAPFGEEVGFKRHGLFVARAARRGKGLIASGANY
jgi:hypothetical protein